ncbi:MAG: cysteine desulfurase NifS [Candidatus Methanomethylophilaceae archaeon]|jgi:cysteine desulfurase
MIVYADNAATTRLSPVAKKAMMPYFDEIYGNPSSLHTHGQVAAQDLKKARDTIARCLNADPREIYFTSGGSEADNQALYSAATYGEKIGKKHIISTKFEHHAVLHVLKKLEKEGFEVTLLDVHKNGIVTADEVKKAIRDDTVIVSVMYANNEIGTIQPISDIGAVCHQKGVIFHTDAVQAVGHINVDVKAQGIDMLSLSGHKFHGPKGIGALYCRKGMQLRSLIDGGFQERGKRAGTENMPAIMGMAAALREACDDMEKNSAHVTKLRDKLIDGLLKIPNSILNGDRKSRLPGNVNMCFEGIEGESLLLFLNERGIEVSSGSACTSGSLDPSHVLLAIGLPHDIAHGSLRVSLCEYNTEEEIDFMIKEVPTVVAYLRDMSPVWDELQKGERTHVIQ